MSEFHQIVARRQHELIDHELRRLVGPSDTQETQSSSRSGEIVTITASSESLAVETEYIYQVQCKVMHRYCRHSMPDIYSVNVFPVGSIVLFTGPETSEADSLDVGVIVKVFSLTQWTEKVSKMRPFNDKEEGELKRVVRLASEEECLLLPRKYEKEEQLLAVCQSYVRDVYRLPIVVYGAEFQFDGKVLTFYYTSDVRADYRELVRTMFNQCMVRIMMRKTNQCKKFVPVSFATQALRTGVSVVGVKGVGGW